MYFELSQNSEGNGGVGAGPWAGQFAFNTDTNNPFDTNHSYANALIGSFRDYTEIDAFSEVIGKRYISEFYVQDTWKANPRLTLDYGLRFLWYSRGTRRSRAAVFVPDRYDPGEGATALRAGPRQQRQRRARSGDRQTLPNVFVGTFVPGTGDRTTAWSRAPTPTTRRASVTARASNPSHALGLAYDLTGDGKTGLHASVGCTITPT